MRNLVCTLDQDNGWGHSTTICHSEKILILNISRFEGKKLVRHPKWDGKKWKYSTIEHLNSIRDLTDRIGLACGSLMEYRTSK